MSVLPGSKMLTGRRFPWTEDLDQHLRNLALVYCRKEIVARMTAAAGIRASYDIIDRRLKRLGVSARRAKGKYPRKTHWPQKAVWIQAVSEEARRASLRPSLALAGERSYRYARVRWRACRALLKADPSLSVKGIALVSGWHWSSFLYGLKRLDGAPAKARRTLREGT